MQAVLSEIIHGPPFANRVQDNLQYVPEPSRRKIAWLRFDLTNPKVRMHVRTYVRAYFRATMEEESLKLLRPTMHMDHLLEIRNHQCVLKGMRTYVCTHTFETIKSNQENHRM